MELKRRHSEFTDRGAQVLAIGQEDRNEEMFWRMLDALEGEVPFHIATDLERAGTPAYDRVTTYLFDPDGRVREVFPTHRELVMPWDAVLAEIDELNAEQPPAGGQGD